MREEGDGRGHHQVEEEDDGRSIVTALLVERVTFAQDSDFEPEPSSLWNSDCESERSPLFGAANREKSTKRSPPPTDSYRFVWLVFYLLGMTTLLPWNFFIAVNDYWNYKFRDPTGNATHTQLQKEFTSYLAIASNVPNALVVILNVFYGRRFKLKIRIIGALSVMSTLFIGVAIMAKIDSDKWQAWFLYSTLIIVVCLNICTAIYQGGLIGVAGKFPPNYVGGMMAGQALGGIFPALVNIVVIALQVSAEDIGFACFMVALSFTILSIGLYCMVQTTTFFRYYAGHRTDSSSGSTVHHSLSVYSHMLVVSWKYLLSIFLTLAVTLTVFPSITVLVVSEFRSDPDNVFAIVYFTPVACFLLYNCGDYLGRSLASWIRQPGTSSFGQNTVLLLSVVRIGFIPLFMFCNAAPDVRNLPVFFAKDAYYYVLMIVFSVSNGYLGSLCMMNGPKCVEGGERQETLASLLVAVLVLGIGLGSSLSYPLVNLL